jgi:glycosyltransferase involved in cell wall biosynthesis
METVLTVIICTYNRALILGDCLGSLCEQTISAEHFRLLVVDNNSTDNTRDIAAQFMAKLLNLQYILEPAQGLSHARNRGLREARTEWVAFLDDDAKASPGWVQSILNTIEAGDFDCFGGPYVAWHRFGPKPAWVEEDFATYLGPGRYGELGRFHIPGGNCAFKKNLAEAAGGFPGGLGMAGKKCAYGEETYLFRKMQENGASMGFVPDMLIEHCVLPYKYTLRWRLLSAYSRGRDGFFSFPFSSVRAFLRIGEVFLWHLPHKFVWCRRKKFPWQRTLVECLGPCLSALGALYSAIRLSRQCRK